MLPVDRVGPGESKPIDTPEAGGDPGIGSARRDRDVVPSLFLNGRR